MSSSKHNQEDKENIKPFTTVTSSSNITALKLQPFHLTALESYSLSTETEAVLGNVDEAVWFKVHRVDASLIGRRVFLYFTDDPARYEVVADPKGAAFLTPSGPFSQAKGPPVHIDPRAISHPPKQLPVVRVNDIPDPEPTDGAGSQGQGDASYPQVPASGSNVGHSNGRQDKASAGGKSRKVSNNMGLRTRRRPETNSGIETAVEGRSKLPRVVIGAVEFLTYYPNHTLWPAVSYRLQRHGWRANDIAKAQLYPRGSLTKDEYDRRRAAMRHQLCKAILHRWPNDTPTTLKAANHPDFQPFVNDPNGTNPNLYDVRFPLPTSGTPPELYRPPRNLPVVLRPKTLGALVHGLVPSRWPSGQDEGPLTKALRWASANNQLQTLTTDDVPTIIAQQNLSVPSDAQTKSWDILALGRVQANIADP